jgi:hypothetical protein
LPGAEGTVPLSPSKWLCAWIVCVTATAVILSVIYLPAWSAIPLSLCFLTGAVISLRRDALLTTPDAVTRLRFSASGLDFQCKDGTWHEGAVLPSSFVNRWLSIVAVDVAPASQRRYIVLMPDSLNGDVARQLRVWLRWAKDQGATLSERNAGSSCVAPLA